MNNNNAPVADATKETPKEPEKESRDITEAIKKIKESVSALPNLWIDKSATLKSVFSGLFECESRKLRFKKLGCRAVFESLISYDASEYIYALDSAVSLLAPNSFIQKITSVARNVTLLDSMVDLITEKVSLTDSYSDTTEVNKMLKDCKDCHIRPRDFDCDSVANIELSDFFLASFVGVHVGESIELTSPEFLSYGDRKKTTINCKLVYKYRK